MEHPRDRRQYPRANDLGVTAVVLARHNQGVEFSIESISAGGACLVGPLAPALGEYIEILFELEACPIDISAEVVRVDRQSGLTDRVGVMFRRLSTANQELIERLVAHHHRNQQVEDVVQ